MAREKITTYLVAGAYQDAGGLMEIAEAFTTKEDLARWILEHPKCRDAGDEMVYAVIKIEAEVDTGQWNDDINVVLNVREIEPYTYVTVGYKE